MAGQILVIPKTLADKRKLLDELRTQRAEVKKHLTKETEALHTQLGEFIKLLEENIRQHNESAKKLTICSEN